MTSSYPTCFHADQTSRQCKSVLYGPPPPPPPPQVKSQPALSERRWYSSEGKSLRRSHSMSVDHREQLPKLQGPRPMSSRPESRASRPGSRASRPASRLDSRPASRLDSRPASRLEMRPPSRLDSRPPSRLETRPVPATQGLVEVSWSKVS